MARVVTRIAALAAFLLLITVVSGLAQSPAAEQIQDRIQDRVQARVQDRTQDKRQNEPGQFDFYVLSLSWSPSFCDAATERSPESASRQPECGERRFAFVVHGLWPQYERGFPEFCQNPAPRLDRNIVSSMLD